MFLTIELRMIVKLFVQRHHEFLSSYEIRKTKGWVTGQQGMWYHHKEIRFTINTEIRKQIQNVQKQYKKTIEMQHATGIFFLCGLSML